jgi:hypothetical protein
MLNRSITATAVATFLALGTHGAFAQTDAGVTTTTATAPAAVSASSQAGTQAAMSSPATTSRARHAARIPGTFALAIPDASRDAQAEAFKDRVTLPPLSGDGGG